MVEIRYCPKCAKASREHIFRKVKCNRCDGLYETIDISRSKYFVIQFVFLMLGFIFLIFAFYLLVANPEKPYEFLGLSVISFTMWIFTLGFQLMDSKDMEFRAEQEVMRKKLEEDEKTPFKRRVETPPRLRRLLDDDEAEAVPGDGEKTGKKLIFGRKEKEEEPKVVRIRRSVSDRPLQPPQVRKKSEKRAVSRTETPIIRDMSSLLDAEDDN